LSRKLKWVDGRSRRHRQWRGRPRYRRSRRRR
jgi:hypothetical protein